MFTGIVEEVGRVEAIQRDGERARLVVGCRQVLADAQVGDSIAVSGCCLTITSFAGAGGDGHTGFSADLMAETLRATALGDLGPGDRVNLEPAMAAGARFGGHLVQGHVDGVGDVVEVDERPGTRFVTVAAPGALARYLVAKGSVTVDGVSLTVVDLPAGGGGAIRFRVGLIPHTCEVTTLGSLTAGDRVNLEVDVVAKYVERLLSAGTTSPYDPEER